MLYKFKIRPTMSVWKQADKISKIIFLWLGLLYGIACVALVEAHNSYDCAKGAFSTWATKIIKQAIFDNFRKNKKHKCVGPLESDIEDDFKSPIPLEILSTLLKEDKNESKTEKQNKKILIDHFIENKSWAEIGRKLKITRERTRQKGIEAIEKIRKKYRLLLDDIEAVYFIRVEK